MNKILTIDEVCQHIGPMWLQGRFQRFSECVVYQSEQLPYLRFKVVTPFERNWHVKAPSATYGKHWRCWEKKPSWEDTETPFEGSRESGVFP